MRPVDLDRLLAPRPNGLWYDRVQTVVLVKLIEHALSYAAPVQPQPAPRHWLEVQAKCNDIIAALKTGQDPGTARRGLEDVRWNVQKASRRAAARAALAALETAEHASRNSAREAAASAVWAAETASWALGTGPGPAKGAADAAWRDIAGMLLQEIDWSLREEARS